MSMKLKRIFDVFSSLCGLLLMAPILLILIIFASISTDASGIFSQTRIGRGGKSFRLYKLRTMRRNSGSTITKRGDARITAFGRFLRRYKLDELPQLWNVLRGDMSLVGPRPDVPGYLDRVEGEAQRLWVLRPGITGPASLKYRDEEALLADVNDPEIFNDTIIWPDKIRINLRYLDERSFWGDLVILKRTILP